MNRDAVQILKEISALCPQIFQQFTLIESAPEDQSIGFKIFIKGPLPQEVEQTVEKILNSRNLAMQVIDGTTVIYNPKSVNNLV